MSWTQSDSDSLTLTLICHPRKNVGMFFYNMVGRWLIPGKNLDISLSFSSNFVQGKKDYTISELVLHLDNIQDLECARRNLPFLEREILIGAESFYHARKILEMKGLNLDDKTSLVQERIASLVRRFPRVFDYDIFTEMQHFLVASKSNFKSEHQPSEISRIICTLYHFRKTIEQRIGSKRHICLKLKRTTLHAAFGPKEVISIFIGLNFLNEHELFEERHLLSALSHFSPVPGSYYKERHEGIQTIYLEIETSADLSQLQQGLSSEIQNRIEQLVPPIFMPRNEEEVMRNILILSQQLKYIRDIPQMIISFDEQTDTELSFTVILVRLVHPNSPPITELFQNDRFSFDRVKVVGQLRRKIPKEASVIRVRLSSEQFMREDYSVDLYAARIHLVKEIEAIFGQVRDYNGGMISKQSENFLRLKKLLGKAANKHALLLQNFFHAIFPVHYSTTLDPQMFRILFSLLLEAQMSEGPMLKTKKANDFLFGILKVQEFSLKDKLPSKDLLTVQMQIHDFFYFGFILLSPDQAFQKSFLRHLTFEENPTYLGREEKKVAKHH